MPKELPYDGVWSFDDRISNARLLFSLKYLGLVGRGWSTVLRIDSVIFDRIAMDTHAGSEKLEQQGRTKIVCQPDRPSVDTNED